jgi:hypothetical protein
MSDESISEKSVRMTWRSDSHCSLSETAIEERVARVLMNDLISQNGGPLPGKIEIISAWEDTRARHYFGGGPGEVPHQFDAVYWVKYKLRNE